MKPTITKVHAHCVNGDLRHDHDLLSKQATDQDAVDAVTRQRDTITRAAADTESTAALSLRIRIKPQQLRHPMMSRTSLDVRRHLRMDEEIMNFQWFQHVTWDSIKDLRGTKFVQPPTRSKFALQQAQHAIPTCHHSQQPHSSLASESAWKALMLSSWLLLGRPQLTPLRATAHTFWMHDWNFFLG